MASALFEFMPYGAPELMDGARSRLARAIAWSLAAWAVVFTVAVVWRALTPAVAVRERVVVVPYRELAAPPPLTNTAAPPPVIAVAAAAHPAVGVPVPVPDVQAPPEQTLASQQEIAASVGSGAAPGDVTTVVIPPPAADELPALGDYVYADELPVLITDVRPVYPEVAREAGVEGEIILRVLVGKDGRVLDVHVDKSTPMLDEAAVEAARKWVFKPALSGNHPVAVWIVRRLQFNLSTAS